MVSKKTVQWMFAYLKRVHKTTRDVVRAFPDDKLDWKPQPAMRCPRELVEHIYAQSLARTKAVLRGSMTMEEFLAENTAPKTGGAAELIAWADAAYFQNQLLVEMVTEEQCAMIVRSFFGEFSGGAILRVTYNEWWHHRGQLTVYLQMLQIPVPSIYEY